MERDLEGVRPLTAFSIIGFWPNGFWGGDMDLLGGPYEKQGKF